MLFLRDFFLQFFISGLKFISITRGGFRGGVWGVRAPPKIRKTYVIQR